MESWTWNLQLALRFLFRLTYGSTETTEKMKQKNLGIKNKLS